MVRWFSGALALCLLAAACSAGDSNGSPEPGRQAGFPVTIDNCGRRTVYTEPPARAVPFDQNITETMLELGLEDQIAAYSRQHFVEAAPVLDAHRAVYEDLPLLSEGNPPGKEALLAVEADFVAAAFDYELTEQFGLEPSQLKSLGVDSYLQEAACVDVGEPVTFEHHYRDIRNLGKIFAVEELAEELVESLRSRTSSIRSLIENGAGAPVRVFVYDSGVDAPMTAGGSSLANHIIEAAGGVNIFNDVEQQFPVVSWEEVLARDPQVIVTMDYSISDPPVGAPQRELLDRRLTSTSALQEDRIVALPLIGFLPGVRNPGTVEELAKFLHPQLR